MPDLWFSPDTPVSSDKSDRYDIESGYHSVCAWEKKTGFTKVYEYNYALIHCAYDTFIQQNQIAYIYNVAEM